ncbi:MAG: copper resistance protein CopC [Thermoleophilia bacterium]
MISTRSPLRGACTAVLAAAALAAGAATASAHAELKATTPAAGAVAPTTIKVVSARFESALHSGTLVVTGPDGARASAGVGKRSARNAKAITVRMRANLKAGRYVARWTAVALDGHKEKGTFRFRLVKRAK